jgi:hypothetical protein
MKTVSSTLHLPEPLDTRLVALYRGWDRLEQRLSDGNPVIDFDLAEPCEPAVIRDRAGVLEELKEIADEVAVLPLSNSIKDIVVSRLRSSITYLMALEGHRFAFDKYVFALLGVRPTPFPEDVLQAQEAVANRAFAAFGANESPLATDKASTLRFQKQFLIRDETKIDRQFAFYLSKWLPIQQRLLKQCLPHFDIDASFAPDDPTLQHWSVSSSEPDSSSSNYAVHVGFASADAYWKNWISGNLARGRIDLSINVHSRHTWFAGAPEILVLHEYCGHALQMMLWRHQLSEGALPQFAGILTVHFPDQVLIEGLAEALAYILPTFGASLERASAALRELQYFTLLVLSNAHIIANTSPSISKAVDYAAEKLPFYGRDRLRRELTARRDNPLFRAYQFSYAFGKKTFLDLYEPLSRPARLRFLALAYSRPLLPTQLHEFGKALLQADRKTGREGSS